MRSVIQASVGAVGLVALLVLPMGALGSAEPATAAPVPAMGDQAPEVGSIVNYKFRQSPMNAGGLTDLADFRGRPLLIEFWGTR